MPDPFHDLLIFDWATALSSTVLASRLLGVPQSTISRKMRSFQADHRLATRRSGGLIKVLSPNGYLEDLRHLAQRFRLLHSALRWSAHPIWAHGIQDDDHHLGVYLNLASLTQDEIGDDESVPGLWLEQRLLDAYLDASLCQTPTRSSTALGIQRPTAGNRNEKGPLNLGIFAGLHGLDDALQSRGWTAWHGPHLEQHASLTLIQQPHASLRPGGVPLDLHVQPRWRYGENLQTHDPHLAVGIKKFEAHLALTLICLNLNTSAKTEPAREDSDPLFAFTPLP